MTLFRGAATSQRLVAPGAGVATALIATLCLWPHATLHAAGAGGALERAKAQGSIRVGFANEAPFAFSDSDGQLTGESVVVFRHVMQKLGVPNVEGILTEWSALIPGLQAGRFEAIVASMYITPARCKQILFSNPTFGIGEALMVKAGNPENLGDYGSAIEKRAKVAFVAGTAEIQHGRLAGMKRSQQVIVPDFAAAAASVKAGRVSAAALTALTAASLAAKDDALERAAPFTFVHEGRSYRGEGSFGFRRQDAALRDAVNTVLARFIGTDEHLKLVAPFGFDRTTLPEKTADQLCAGR